MIFQYTLTDILLQNKTQTRRIIKPNETAIRRHYNQIESVLHNGRCKWQVGQNYAVQPGRGQSEVARIRLTQINSQHITRISTSDAMAEGFESRQDFLQTWQKIHGENALNVRVWVLTFELIMYIKNTETFISQEYGEFFANAAK
jgi:hypothetical protein